MTAADNQDLHLPTEICREIVSRLPVKSILRFRSVRKSWYSLISCPRFISDYSTRDGNRLLLQHLDYTGVGISLSAHDESFTESYEPQEFRGQLLKIVGSCNGLICLSDDPSDQHEYGCPTLATFWLWNPAIRKVVELPSRSNPLDHRFAFFGFGFDSKTSDYKVLFAVQDLYPGLSNYECLCEIFDLSKGVWRGPNPLVTSCNGFTYSSLKQECYLNGAAHWIAHNVILSFNMSDEVCTEMSMPDSAEFTDDHDGKDCYTDTRCGTFDGLIYLIRCKTDPMVEICSVWLMKEYGVTESWTKLFNIDMQSSPAFLDASPRQFRLWKNGEVLVVHHQEVRMDEDTYFVGEQVLSSYNGESKICKRVFSFTKYIFNLCLYQESLVLL